MLRVIFDKGGPGRWWEATSGIAGVAAYSASWQEAVRPLHVQHILAGEHLDGVSARLRWLPRPSTELHARTVTWEDDPWARGGYAFFDPAFDPHWRDVLAMPAGRIVFAGEHTSVRWHGYMNGAIESGYRAAADVDALQRGTLG